MSEEADVLLPTEAAPVAQPAAAQPAPVVGG